MMDRGQTRPTGTAGWALLAAVMLSNSSAVVGTISPTFVDAFIAGGMPLASASQLAATEFFSIAIMMLCSPLLITRIDRRLLGLFGVIAGASGQLLSFQVESTPLAMLCRAVAGIGEGALSAVAIASLAAAASPDRAFGMAVSANQIAATIMLALIAWASAMSPTNSAMIIMAVFIAINIVFVPALPRRSAVQASLHEKAPAGRLVPIMCGIAATFLLAGGFGAVWPVAGQIISARGVSQATLATSYTIAGFGGIVGGVVVAFLGDRLGRIVPVVFGTLVMATALALVSSAFFAPALIAIMFFWSFNIPYYLGLQAVFDPSGRLAVLTSAMIPFGIASGQVVAGQVATQFTIVTVAIVGAAALVASLLLMLLAFRLISQVRRPAVLSV